MCNEIKHDENMYLPIAERFRKKFLIYFGILIKMDDMINRLYRLTRKQLAYSIDYYLLNVNQEEIANAHSISRSTVSRTIKRATIKLLDIPANDVAYLLYVKENGNSKS